MQRSELYFNGYDQTKLYLQSWQTQKPCGTIVFTHGQAEHSDCYERLIQGFQKSPQGKNWNFVGWDLRGHGKSDGLRGFAKDFDDYVLDYKIFLDLILSSKLHSKNSPFILLGHSMGALIQTVTLSEKKYTHFTAQILSSPLFGLSVEVPTWKDSGSEILNQIFPKLTLGNEIINENLTRDPLVIAEYEKDIYRHNKISSGVFLGFKREFKKVSNYARLINLPTFMQISDNDPVVSSSSALEFFELLSSNIKDLKIYENSRHELFNDINRDEVIKNVIHFCEQFKKEA